MKRLNPLKGTILSAVLILLLTACVSGSSNTPTIQPTPEENARLFADQNVRLSAMMPILRKQKRGQDFLVSETGISKLLDAAALGGAGQTRSQIRQFIGDTQMPLGNDSVYKNANLIYFANYNAIHKSYLKALPDFIMMRSLDAMKKRVDRLTNGMIPDALANVSPASRVVLSNVMTFDAEWASPFNENCTAEKDFTARCSCVSKVGKIATKVGKVATMHTTLHTHYLEDETIRAVSIPFVKGYHLLVAMNRETDASPAGASGWLFTEQGRHINDLMAARDREVHLALPRLDLSASHDLIPPMKALGIHAMFDEKSSDFRNMTTEKLWVALFEQKIRMKADEKGAKAAAVTTMAIRAMAMPPVPSETPVEFKVNHPFAFAIIKGHGPRQIVLAGEVSSLGICQNASSPKNPMKPER